MRKSTPLELLTITVILLLAAFLRIYHLDTIPNGLIEDEAMRGYDAYSILRTGKDSFGNVSIFLRGFEDYTPALYTYLTIPFVAIFNLSAYSTRLAAALVGVFVVALSYQLEFCDEVEPIGGKWCKMVIADDRRDDHAPTHCSISSHYR